MEQRKYESIDRVQKVSNRFFHEGDIINISEKIDGANASFMVDEDGNRHFYSRNKELVDGETLRGFVDWANENINWDAVYPYYIYYGEWVVKHKIEYNDDVKNTFVLFDIWSIREQCYWRPIMVYLDATFTGLETPPCFYEGKFKSLEHIEQFVGKSEFAKDDKGEGIVIRNLTTGEKAKWVSEAFSEVKHKTPKVVDSQLAQIMDDVLTENRVEKAIYKGLDEGHYDSFEVRNYGAIMKFLGNFMVDDIMKEEGDLVPSEKVQEFEKMIKKKTPCIARKILDKIEG